MYSFLFFSHDWGDFLILLTYIFTFQIRLQILLKLRLPYHLLRGFERIQVLVIIVLQVPQVTHVHHLQSDQLIAQPIVLQYNLRAYLVNRAALNSAEKLVEIRSMDLVQFYLR